MSLLHKIDNFLNKFTMYRVVLYGLLITSIFTIFYGFLRIISYSGFNLLVSASTLLLTCYLSNIIFARVFKAVTNIESSLITGLILFLIMPPAENLNGMLILFIAGIISMLSKYILAINKKHIFNPVAITAFILGFTANSAALWWVATPPMLPITAIIGLLVVRKVRKFTLFFSFMITALIVSVGSGIINKLGGIELVLLTLTSFPLVFFATIMLTEPRTMPPLRKYQVIFGVLVGVLFGVQFNFGPIYSTPELTLLIGNIFTYFVSPKQNFLLKLSETKKLASDIYGYSFISNQKPSFAAGQYLEWTLPHKTPDTRGNRRYFTIASSPTEEKLQIGVKISEKSSSFKSSLLQLKEGTILSAGSLSGDFMLPVDPNEKLVFIAGGIGITPFRSMIKYLLDSNEKRDITLFYASPAPSDFVYQDIFENAKNKFILKTIYVITKTENAPANWTGKTGRINEEMIKSEIRDFKERKFYMSGPNSMVQAYKELLATLGIPKNKIVTDYFPGF
ncbi:MAG TPA: hypothetical protein VM077_04320 [Candidatus Limnocylindrales bacterium]|nr:hypothetical protein [Candidatus Limnocylindrales bacterium]